LRKLRIGIIDLVTKTPGGGLWAKTMNANFASIMPQVVATWCEQAGHDVQMVCYTGQEDLSSKLDSEVDMVFISSFTQAAQLAYALSQMFRARGAVTALGGPHARCYPQDAVKYFDYVFGFTHREQIFEALADCSPHRPVGMRLSATSQPESIPGVKERWKFVEQTLRQAPLIKIIPMIGSMGCPYTCSFCIDAEVPYQPLSFELLREDLQFLRTKFKRPRVGWHDPNFGVRFEDYMSAIEDSVPENSIDFIAESSLALLSEPHLKRLKRNGFKGMLPGIESWFDMGDKSKTGSRQGEKKLDAVADHVNMLLDYIPYVQTNFVLGMDTDFGSEPYELTKRFIDRTPGTFPGYSLLSAFGQAAPLNLEYQQDGRVLPVPFHFLNNNHAMNVKPKNYTWPEFYDQVIDLTAHSFSWPSIANRFIAGRTSIPKWINFLRAVSSEGFGRLKYYREVRRLLDEDRGFRAYWEQETTVLPDFYLKRMKQELGPFWEWLPKGAIYHEPNAYLEEHLAEKAPAVVKAPAA
jgi:hypothetical protein